MNLQGYKFVFLNTKYESNLSEKISGFFRGCHLSLDLLDKMDFILPSMTLVANLHIFLWYTFAYLSKMKIRIATARLYGNKVYYFQETDIFTREFAAPREEPIIYCDKDKMFEEWSTLEILIIHDKKTEEEYKRNKYYN